MLTILNDLHIGVLRSGGTTPATAWNLRQQTLQATAQLLDEINTDLVINGDLFDSYACPHSDLLAAFEIFSQWLERGHKLWLVMGNHDLSTDSTKLSAAEFFGKILESSYDTVQVLRGSGWINSETYAISHVSNQDLFDIELSKVPECKYLLLHCNYDSKFAAQSDNSLNLTEAAAKDLPVQTVVLGHEHQRRVALDGKVQIIGNQIPTSVADCLGNKQKFYARLSPELELVTCWRSEGDFIELDWQELREVPCRFVRITGEATAAQAPDVAKAISRYRSASEALVVTNAVKIAQESGEGFAQDLETLQGFNVLDALLGFFTPEEAAVIKENI